MLKTPMTWMAFLAAVVWWTAYARSEGSGWYLVAALLCSLSWLILALRKGHQDTEAVVQKAVGDKGKRR